MNIEKIVFDWDGPYKFKTSSANLFHKNWSKRNCHGIYIFVIDKLVHYVGIQTKINYSVFNRIMEHYHGIISGREDIYDNGKLVWKKAINKYPENFTTLFDLNSFKTEILNKSFNYLSKIDIYVSDVKLANNKSYKDRCLFEIAEKYMIYNYSPAKNSELKRNCKNKLRNDCKAYPDDQKKINNFSKIIIGETDYKVNMVEHVCGSTLISPLINCLDEYAFCESKFGISFILK